MPASTRGSPPAPTPPGPGSRTTHLLGSARPEAASPLRPWPRPGCRRPLAARAPGSAGWVRSRVSAEAAWDPAPRQPQPMGVAGSPLPPRESPPDLRSVTVIPGWTPRWHPLVCGVTRGIGSRPAPPRPTAAGAAAGGAGSPRTATASRSLRPRGPLGSSRNAGCGAPAGRPWKRRLPRLLGALPLGARPRAGSARSPPRRLPRALEPRRPSVRPPAASPRPLASHPRPPPPSLRRIVTRNKP